MPIGHLKPPVGIERRKSAPVGSDSQKSSHPLHNRRATDRPQSVAVNSKITNNSFQSQKLQQEPEEEIGPLNHNELTSVSKNLANESEVEKIDGNVISLSAAATHLVHGTSGVETHHFGEKESSVDNQNQEPPTSFSVELKKDPLSSISEKKETIAKKLEQALAASEAMVKQSQSRTNQAEVLAAPVSSIHELNKAEIEIVKDMPVESEIMSEQLSVINKRFSFKGRILFGLASFFRLFKRIFSVRDVTPEVKKLEDVLKHIPIEVVNKVINFNELNKIWFKKFEMINLKEFEDMASYGLFDLKTEKEIQNFILASQEEVREKVISKSFGDYKLKVAEKYLKILQNISSDDPIDLRNTLYSYFRLKDDPHRKFYNSFVMIDQEANKQTYEKIEKIGFLQFIYLQYTSKNIDQVRKMTGYPIREHVKDANKLYKKLRGKIYFRQVTGKSFFRYYFTWFLRN